MMCKKKYDRSYVVQENTALSDPLQTRWEGLEYLQHLWSYTLLTTTLEYVKESLH